MVKLFYFFVVLLFEIVDHRYCGPSVSLLKLASIWMHVKSYVADFVGLMVTIAGHYNGTFEFINDGFLDFMGFWLLIRVSLTSLMQTFDLFVDQGEAIVDGKIFGDVVDDEVKSTLEDP